MDILQSLILGIIQGITEFLPISSSGHLVLTPWLFGWQDSGLSFDVALHFGTLLAVIAYFAKDWIDIFKAAVSGKKAGNYNEMYLWILAVATVPGVLAGFFLNDLAESVFRSPLIVAFTLVFFGLLLFLADKYFQKKREFGQAGFKDAILIGLAQALAIVPGTSRSGITMTAGMALGMTRKSAARFSFLMATPVIFGASVYKAGDFFAGGVGMAEAAGIFAAFLSGYLAIAGLLKFIEKIGYHWFFYYRLLLAAVIMFFVFYR
ncbi:MAG: undecaprenyl-diphosphate phosphatase [Candidatus Moranbacteria bacterium]|nr:undecaprenyl-diphosphate phosphatase [Candidatus Moranbacteria bacterium]